MQFTVQCYGLLSVSLTCFFFHTVFTESFMPQAFRDLERKNILDYKDSFVGEARTTKWMLATVIMECVFELPYFLYVLYYLFFYSGMYYPEHFRTSTLVYTSHTVTTTAIILSHFWQDHDDERYAQTFEERVKLCKLYIPFHVVPLFMLLYTLWSPRPENEAAPKKKAN